MVNKLVEALERPFSWEGHDLAIRLSTGIALFPSDASTANALKQIADERMYATKAARKAQAAR